MTERGSLREIKDVDFKVRAKKALETRGHLAREGEPFWVVAQSRGGDHDIPPWGGGAGGRLRTDRQGIRRRGPPEAPEARYIPRRQPDGGSRPEVR